MASRAAPELGIGETPATKVLQTIEAAARNTSSNRNNQAASVAVKPATILFTRQFPAMIISQMRHFFTHPDIFPPVLRSITGVFENHRLHARVIADCSEYPSKSATWLKGIFVSVR